MKRLFLLFLIPLIFTFASTQTNDEKREEYIKAIKNKIDQIKERIPFIKNPIKEYTQIAHLFLEIEEYDNAIDYFNKALTLDPHNPNIYYMLAMIYEKKGERLKAIECWQSVVRYSKNKKIIEIAQKHIEILKDSR